MLFLKGIDQLLKEGIPYIETAPVHRIESLKTQLLNQTHDLFIVHLDFTIENPAYLMKHLTEEPLVVPLLILTDEPAMAEQLFQDTVEKIYFLDIRNTVTNITQKVISILNSKEQNPLPND